MAGSTRSLHKSKSIVCGIGPIPVLDFLNLNLVLVDPFSGIMHRLKVTRSTKRGRASRGRRVPKFGKLDEHLHFTFSCIGTAATSLKVKTLETGMDTANRNELSN